MVGKSISFEFAIPTTLALFFVAFFPGIFVSTFVLVGTLAFIITSAASAFVILYGMIAVPFVVAALIKLGNSSLAFVCYVIVVTGSVFFRPIPQLAPPNAK